MIPSDIRRALVHQWPLRVRNNSGEVIPPGAVMRIVSSTAVDGQLVYTCDKPNATDQRSYLVNGPFAIGTGSSDEGIASTLCEAGYVLYETGSPDVNEVWGPKSGQWSIVADGHGFTITGGITTLAGNAAVSAVQGGYFRPRIGVWTSYSAATIANAGYVQFTGFQEIDSGFAGSGTNNTAISLPKIGVYRCGFHVARLSTNSGSPTDFDDTVLSAQVVAYDGSTTLSSALGLVAECHAPFNIDVNLGLTGFFKATVGTPPQISVKLSNADALDMEYSDATFWAEYIDSDWLTVVE